jgi:hypothetical protein
VTAAGFGYSCAVALALVLVVAGWAKGRDLRATERSFTDLGLPRPATMARVVPAVEVGTAVVLVLTPALGGVVAVVLLAFFTTFLVTRLRAGTDAPCSCFGSTRRDPISAANLVGNGFLLLLGLAALLAPGPALPTAVDLAVLAVAVAVEIGVYALVQRQTEGRRRPGDATGRPPSPVRH